MHTAIIADIADSTYMLTANKRGRATCLHKNPGKLERLRDQGPPAACPDSKHSIQPHCTESMYPPHQEAQEAREMGSGQTGNGQARKGE